MMRMFYHNGDITPFTCALAFLAMLALAIITIGG